MVVDPEQGRESNERDLLSVDAGSWPRRAFPPIEGRREGSVPVVIKQSILNTIHCHGQQDSNVEVCGVLVGRGYRDDQGPFVYLEGSIRGDHAGSQAAQVTFTAETWDHIYEVFDSVWPGSRILGWYHTHPGFGVFLSGMDLFIHENFFGASDQVALVYDPASGDEGIFIWSEGKPVRREFLVEKDIADATPPRREALSAPTSLLQTAAGRAGDSDDTSARLDRLERRYNALFFGVVVLWIVAVAWPVVAFWLLPRFGFGAGMTPPDHRQEPPPERSAPSL